VKGGENDTKHKRERDKRAKAAVRRKSATHTPTHLLLGRVHKSDTKTTDTSRDMKVEQDVAFRDGQSTHFLLFFVPKRRTIGSILKREKRREGRGKEEGRKRKGGRKRRKMNKKFHERNAQQTLLRR
jgi:hypothetical protein